MPHPASISDSRRLDPGFGTTGRPPFNPKELKMSAIALSTFSRRFHRIAAGLVTSLALGVLSAHAAITPFPADFHSSQVVNGDATINVRVGGHGPAVVLIHGFGETGDMWSPMAALLEKDHTVVVPDLRGMGLSSHPAGGYDKWTQAGDIRAVLDKLGIDRADIVGHDIGVMVAYAYAARYPDKTSRLVVIDSPIPGIPPWNQIVRMPALWHFNFGGPDAERLVAGRERIYLDRFWDEFAGDPSKIDEATRRHYAAIYARPGAMHSAFAQFLAIDQKDEADNLKAMETKLTMPVLAIGAEKAFGANVGVIMRNAATNVQEVIVPNAGHWLMDEAPALTIAAVQNFLEAQ
jgi:pimeloyl-ACP methyl ester carboxylesterase